MLANGIRETTATTGTGNLTLSDAGAVRFGQAFQASQLVKYSLLDASGNQVEWGIGQYLGGNQIARTVVCGTWTAGVLNISTPTAANLAGTTTVICAEIMGGSVPGLFGISSTNGSSGAFIPEPMLLAGSASSFALVADRLYLQPARMASPRRLTAMKFRVSTNGGGVAQIGLYKCSETGEPKELLMSSGDIAVPFSGITTWALASPLVLPPDWYYIAFASKGATPTINTTGAGYFSGATPLGTDATVVQAIAHKYATLTAGWASLPTTCPTSLTSAGATNPPAVAVVLG